MLQNNFWYYTSISRILHFSLISLLLSFFFFLSLYNGRLHLSTIMEGRRLKPGKNVFTGRPKQRIQPHLCCAPKATGFQKTLKSELFPLPLEAKCSFAPLVTEICGCGATVPGLSPFRSAGNWSAILRCVTVFMWFICHGSFSVIFAEHVLLYVELCKPWTFRLL